MSREVEDSHMEQLWSSFCELRAHVAQECDRVFVTKETFDKYLSKKDSKCDA